MCATQAISGSFLPTRPSPLSSQVELAELTAFAVPPADFPFANSLANRLLHLPLSEMFTHSPPTFSSTFSPLWTPWQPARVFISYFLPLASAWAGWLSLPALLTQLRPTHSNWSALLTRSLSFVFPLFSTFVGSGFSCSFYSPAVTSRRLLQFFGHSLAFAPRSRDAEMPRCWHVRIHIHIHQFALGVRGGMWSSRRRDEVARLVCFWPGYVNPNGRQLLGNGFEWVPGA